MSQDTCSAIARQAHEPLLGTAGHSPFHFVMAAPKAEWIARIEEMPGAPGALAQIIKPLKGQAMLSLRNCASEERGTIWLFPHGYRFDNLEPNDYARLVSTALNGEVGLAFQEEAEKTYILQCTHGLRDQCCALHGGMMLRALHANAAETEEIWEVSHLGGHRFAPTMVVLPARQWYGGMSPQNAPDLLDAVRNRRILPQFYRGNSAYPAPLQVAEAWGWQILLARRQQAKINLVNPAIDGLSAQVEVSLNFNDRSETTRLELRGEPYTFTSGCDGGTKERIMWSVVSETRVMPNEQPTP